MRTSATTPAGRRRAAARGSGGGSSAPTRGRTSPGRARPTRRPPRRSAPRAARGRGRARTGRRRTLRASPGLAALRALRLRRPSGSLRRRAAVLGAIVAALAVGYFGWFRDSSLVAVRAVKVDGVSGSDRARIVAALTEAARGMTTLHVQTDRLESAVRSFPTVAGLSADASFPHGLEIDVTERDPAVVASDGHREVAVAGDGSLLPGVKGGGKLPSLRVSGLPASGRLTGAPLAEATVVGAAPTPLRPLIAAVAASRDYGVVVTMRGGIVLRFGSPERASGKWAAAAAILADPRVTGAPYVDVREPERPAVGG